MLRKHLVLIMLAAWMPAQAGAIYKFVDADGNVTFTNKYRPGAVKLIDTPNTPVTVRAPRATKHAPKNFPKVDDTTQRKRDNLRRTLLLDERHKEEQGLASVQSALDAPGNLSKTELNKLAEQIQRHQKNIELLNQELERIK